LLSEICEGKEELVEPAGRDTVEEVALVSGDVGGAGKADMAVGPDKAGVVAGG